MRRTTARAGLVMSALVLTLGISVVAASAAAARAWLGVATQEIGGELREGLDLEAGAAGVLVNRVVDESPADKAGLRQGDVITRFNSRTVESPSELQRLVADARPGQDVALEIVRHGDRRTLTVTLGTRSEDDGESMAPEPPDAPSPPDAPPPPGDDEHERSGHREVRVKIVQPDKPTIVHQFELQGDPGDITELRRMVRPELDGMSFEGLRAMANARSGWRLGVQVQSLNADLASALGAPSSDGVLVLGVRDDTPAARAGLRSGDVILAVNGGSVKNPEALVAALRDVDGKVSLSVSRKGERRTVEAELGPAPRMGHGEGTLIPKRQGRMGGSDEDRPRMREDAGGDDLRQQVDELRQQLRELRKQLEGMKHE